MDHTKISPPSLPSPHKTSSQIPRMWNYHRSHSPPAWSTEWGKARGTRFGSGPWTWKHLPSAFFQLVIYPLPWLAPATFSCLSKDGSVKQNFFFYDLVCQGIIFMNAKLGTEVHCHQFLEADGPFITPCSIYRCDRFPDKFNLAPVSQRRLRARVNAKPTF